MVQRLNLGKATGCSLKAQEIERRIARLEAQRVVTDDVVELRLDSGITMRLTRDACMQACVDVLAENYSYNAMMLLAAGHSKGFGKLLSLLQTVFRSSPMPTWPIDNA